MNSNNLGQQKVQTVTLTNGETISGTIGKTTATRIEGNDKIKLKSVLPGTLFFSFFWMLGSWCFSLYLSNLNAYNKVYGTIEIDYDELDEGVLLKSDGFPSLFYMHRWNEIT